jgi:hypothetical protein
MQTVAVVVVVALVVVVAVVLLRSRSRSASDEHVGVAEFQREMRALSPEADKHVVDDGGVRIIGRPTDEV